MSSSRCGRLLAALRFLKLPGLLVCVCVCVCVFSATVVSAGFAATHARLAGSFPQGSCDAVSLAACM